jgi:hypothetical protein
MDPSQDTDTQGLAELFVRMNRTELYQHCRSAGLSVQPNWRREDYLATLLGPTPPKTVNVIDELREGIILFIGEFWNTLQAQLKCPAKNLRSPDPDKIDPKPCYHCVDMQVVACWSNLSPAHQQRLVQLRRK